MRLLPVLILVLFVHAFGAERARAQAFSRLSTAGDLGLGQPGGWGSAWGDYNNDGYPDLLIVSRPNQLYRNNGDGTFSSISVDHLTTTNLNQNSAVWTDVNGDGYLDLYVSHLGPGTPIPRGEPLNPRVNFLYVNEGPPSWSLTRITEGDLTSSLNMTWTSEFSDYDSDGDLDLFVWGDQGDADLFYENDGDGGFSLTTGKAFLNPGEFSAGGQLLDMDGDGDQDLLVINFQPVNNELYRNLLQETGTATFERLTGGSITNDFEQDLVASWGDFDNDGDMDVFTPVWGRNDRYYRNDGDLEFLRIFEGRHVNDGGGSLGNAAFDFDNDGMLDLYVTDQQSTDRIYRGKGDGTFQKLGGADAGAVVTQSGSGFDSGAAVSDFDNDGDLDLVAPSSGGSHKIYRNDANGDNSWVQIDLEGVQSNSLGVGAVVRAKSDISEMLPETWQMRVMHGGATGDRGQSHQRIHFGLGEADRIDSLRVEWPSGVVDVLTDIGPNQFLKIREGDHPVTTGLVDHPERPAAFELNSIHPNPARHTAHLNVTLPRPAKLRLEVFDILGRVMLETELGQTPSGRHSFSIDTVGMPAGHYLARVTTGSATIPQTEYRRLVVIR